MQISGLLVTGNGDMRATKEVVRQKIIAAHDLIKCHPLTPEPGTELFTAAEQHLSHVGRAVAQQTGISSYHWKTEMGCGN